MRSERGFTLIELLIVMAILAILASIAYSSYSTQLQKTRRTDAKEALLRAAALQERFYLSNSPNRYASQAEIDQLGGANTLEGFYTISVVNNQAHGTTCTEGTCFTLTGTVNSNGAQANDTNCQRFAVDNLGRKRSYNAGGTESENCW